MTEYQSLFLDEAGELFSNAYDRLLAAEESDRLDDEAIAELFRILHTIKGGGGSVDFDHLSRYAHGLENMLSQLRDHKIAYQSGMAAFLVDSLDQMTEVLKAESQNRIDEAEYDMKLRRLEGKINEYIGSSAAPQPSPEAKAPSADEGFMLFDPAQIEAAQKSEERAIAPSAESGEKNEQNDRGEQNEQSGAQNESYERETGAYGAVKNASIRVDLNKIDLLLNRVGELVIANSMLSRFCERLESRTDRDEMGERLAQLTRHIRNLQDAVMGVRMIPMEHIYAKLPKIARDIAKKLGKRARLIHSGDSVEIDKMIIEGLNDPLMHIIRNALDHGLESPEERKALGKNPIGLISVAAMQENGQIVIVVQDDGRGIDSLKVVSKAIERRMVSAQQVVKMSDDEKNDLVFLAGLTTADTVTDISGRGVGMDIVRNNIAKLGGIVRVKSQKGRGTSVTITLPLTLAILDGLSVSVGDRRYILPLSSVVESLQPRQSMIQSNGDGSRTTLMLRDSFIPILELYSLFNIKPKFTEPPRGILIVVRAGGERIALFVDSFGAQQQVVVKSLEKNFRRVGGIGGATVQGDGEVVLILDPLGLVEKERELRRTAAR
ncbi:MAG: chemotaxis protein CheA [Helicobacteraceae bacterium]|jgi:two-component system chemotaxis sensor kinase CheA|nr:chemotaxis protein CheA [Helicobacteraceae bacterium]